MSAAIGAPQRDVFGAALVDLGRHDPRIVVLDGDLANSTKVDLFAAAYPERFFEAGLAEQNMMGAAAGLAAMGYVPFISTFACFAVCRTLDQIRVLVAQTRLNVKIIGSYGGILVGLNGKTHQVLDDFAIMRAMPNMTVIAPADAEETRQVIEVAASTVGPMYVRLTRDAGPVVFDASYRFELGRGVRLRQGSAVALISTGVQTARVLEAAEILASEGIDATVLHLPTIKPIDAEAVVAAARDTGLVVTSEDHTIVGGLGGAVAEVLGAEWPTRIIRTGIADTFAECGSNADLLDKYGLSARRVTEVVREAVRKAVPRSAGARRESGSSMPGSQKKGSVQ